MHETGVILSDSPFPLLASLTDSSHSIPESYKPQEATLKRILAAIMARIKWERSASGMELQ